MLKRIGASMVYDGRIGRKSAIISNELLVDFLPATVYIYDENPCFRGEVAYENRDNKCDCCLVAVALMALKR